MTHQLLIFLLMLPIPRNLILFLFLLALLLLLDFPLCHLNLLSIYRIFIAIWMLIFFIFHLNWLVLPQVNHILYLMNFLNPSFYLFIKLLSCPYLMVWSVWSLNYFIRLLEILYPKWEGDMASKIATLEFNNTFARF